MFITSPAFTSQPRIRHAFFTRRGGVSQGLYASLNGGVGSSDEPARVAENRRRMTSRLGVAPDALATLYQVHSAKVVVVEHAFAHGDRPQADAMVSRVPGLALGITSADCGPVLFADPEAGIVGAAHAGWRGALDGVLAATLSRMVEIGARRDRILAVLGPTIGQKSYEVGPEFVARFLDADARTSRHFRSSGRDGHALFDLPGFIGAKLLQAGIGAFHDVGLCTYADEERFFSYRRATHRDEPDYGRLISAIALSP